MRSVYKYLGVFLPCLPYGLAFASSASTAIFFEAPPPKSVAEVVQSNKKPLIDKTVDVSKQPLSVPTLPEDKPSLSLLGPTELMSKVLDNYPSILSKRSEIQSADYQRKAAKFQFLPSPTISSEKRQGQPQVIVARLTQTVWSGGRVTTAYSSSQLRVARAQADMRNTEIDAFFRISSLYQNYLSQIGRLASQEKGMDRLKDLQEMMARRVSQGVSSESDLILINSRISQAAVDLITLKAGISVILTQISQMVGSSVSTKTLIASDAQAIKNIGGLPIDNGMSLDDAINDVLQNHPLYKRATLDVELAKQEVKLAKSTLSPEFSIRVEHQYGETPTSLREGGRVFFDVRFAPSAGLGTFAGIQAASSRVTAIEQQLEQSRRDIIDRVSFEWTDYQSALQQVKTLEASRKDSEEIVESSLRLFVAGRKTWLDLLNSNRELTQIEQRESDAKSLRVSAALRLKILFGQYLDQDTSLDDVSISAQ